MINFKAYLDGKSKLEATRDLAAMLGITWWAQNRKGALGNKLTSTRPTIPECPGLTSKLPSRSALGGLLFQTDVIVIYPKMQSGAI
jgi:hypothetical protein